MLLKLKSKYIAFELVWHGDEKAYIVYVSEEIKSTHPGAYKKQFSNRKNC